MLADGAIRALLCAGSIVILSVSQVGMSRALKCWLPLSKRTTCGKKTKALVFAQHNKWKINGTPTEQVHTYKYLEVPFQVFLSWSSHSLIRKVWAKVAPQLP